MSHRNSIGQPTGNVSDLIKRFNNAGVTAPKPTEARAQASQGQSAQQQQASSDASSTLNRGRVIYKAPGDTPTTRTKTSRSKSGSPVKLLRQSGVATGLRAQVEAKVASELKLSAEKAQVAKKAMAEITADTSHSTSTSKLNLQELKHRIQEVASHTSVLKPVTDSGQESPTKFGQLPAEPPQVRSAARSRSVSPRKKPLQRRPERAVPGTAVERHIDRPSAVQSEQQDRPATSGTPSASTPQATPGVTPRTPRTPGTPRAPLSPQPRPQRLPVIKPVADANTSVSTAEPERKD